MSQVVVPARFNGPPRSANGGYAAGVLACATIGGQGLTSTVRLEAPPPMEVTLPVEEVDGWQVATYDGTPILRSQPADHELTPVAPVDLAIAEQAMTSYAGHRNHPFPSCFSCGTARDEGDGLRIFPGRLADGRVASTWTPAASLYVDWHEASGPEQCAAPAIAWAALDCVGGWATDLDERMAVLGTMSCRIDELPTVGEPHVVVGELRGVKGRVSKTAASLYSPAGQLIGTAEHVWIAVNPEDLA